jgi:phosphoribosylamine--glycine ligase/phosphoribosylformylglycinamidine cyclo-ligase
MEGSKAFSKDFMARHAIPTAQFKTFQSSEFEQAKEYVKTCGFSVVLKASGLAAGKGVLIPSSIEEAITGLQEIMVDNVFGTAGLQIDYLILRSILNWIVLSIFRQSSRGGRAPRRP